MHRFLGEIGVLRKAQQFLRVPFTFRQIAGPIDFRPANATTMIVNIDPALFKGWTGRRLLGFEVEELDRRAIGQIIEG